ncbi:MAG: sialate O-acetylesterase [Chitinophagaceae bacterium]|nr:sialate O-acetylesterase [Chitinophagaceae bacterium]
MRKALLCSIYLLVYGMTPAVAQGDLRLPAILGDHAVLQRSSDVKLWGWCPSVWTMKVVCSWAPADTVTATPGRNNAWTVVVRTPAKRGPYTIRFIGDKETREIHDILVGEVWLCSGQSNMEYNVKWGVSDAGDALESPDNQDIRWFQPVHASADYPLGDVPGEWKLCTAAEVKDFSAVAYFFGRRLQAQLQTPVGLIGSYWGGTSVQPWTPKEVYEKDTALASLARRIQPSWAPVAGSVIYNAMIYPLTRYCLAGVIWYQGESNNGEPEDYGRLFAGMIRGWRAAFQQDLPFYYVQIAPWSGYPGINGALLREQQAGALSLPKTGMAAIGDLIEDVKELHPSAKRQVGERLANLPLKERYGMSGLQPYFPKFSGLRLRGMEAIVTLSSLGRLNNREKDIRGFEVAGADRMFYPAVVRMEKDGSFIVRSPRVQQPAAVRYCFTNDGRPGLYDINGLPVLPFRTDKW